MTRDRARIAYVLEVFPRYSETFVLNELLAHERAGQTIEVFSLRAPEDGRFHEALGELRAPVTYVPWAARDQDLWETIRDTASALPDTWAALQDATAADARDVHQGLSLAAALARLLDDAALRVRLAPAARARAESHFEADRNAARLRELAWPDAPAAPAACGTTLASVS